MEEKKQAQPNQIQIELPADKAAGVYTNLAVIAHSQTEFVMDFIQILPGTPKAEVRSRVIMTPENAKRLLAALAENVQKFERSFGEVRTGGPEGSLPPNFGPAGYA